VETGLVHGRGPGPNRDRTPDARLIDRARRLEMTRPFFLDDGADFSTY
jgi:hypothetical protein